MSKKELLEVDSVDGTVQGGSMHDQNSEGVDSEASPSCCATRQALEAKRKRGIVMHQVAACGTRMMCKKLSS